MIPEDFNPNDENIWEKNCFAFDFSSEPDVDFSEYDLSSEDVLGLIWLKNLREVVTSQGLSLFITVDGRHRTGKSRFVATMSCLFDKTFEKHMEERIVQSAEELLRLVEKIDREQIKNPVIVVDEAGATVSSMDWFEKVQKAIVKTMTVIGYLHPTIIFITTVRDLVLSGIRKMSHVYMKVTRSNNRYACVVPYDIQYNSMRKKYYHHRQIVRINGIPITLNKVKVTLPPPEIDERYSKIELSRKPQLLQEIKDDVKKAKIKSQRQIPDLKELANSVAENFEDFKTSRSRAGDRRVDVDIIAVKYRVPYRYAKVVKREAEILLNAEKGDVEAKKENVQESSDTEGRVDS